MKRHYATKEANTWAAHSFQLRFRHAPCSPRSVLFGQRGNNLQRYQFRICSILNVCENKLRLRGKKSRTMQNGAEARRPNHFSNNRVAVDGNPVSAVSCFRRFVGNPSFTRIMEGLPVTRPEHA